MANGNGKDGQLRLTDGQLDWAGGVQSDNVRTKELPVIPNGIKQNQLSWGINVDVRGGSVGQRMTLHPLVQSAPWSGLYQGGILYQPDFTDPILVLAIGGRLYRVRVDTDNSVTDLSALYGPTLPATIDAFHWTQSEMFGIVQVGDFLTLPLFYDFGIEGVRPESLRQSAGIVTPGVSNPTNELPASGPMDFYAQRTWYAFGRAYAAGDISGSTFSGSAAFDYRDSVLKVTENPVAYAGDAFALPTLAGNIRALAHASNIDSNLGDAQLFVFTRRAVYSCLAPISRDDWTAATNNQQPLQRLVLDKGGSYGDRGIVQVSGDLFFPSPPNGDIRSIQATLRYQQQWGYVPLSRNVNRLLLFNDRALLRASTGINFDNRLLMASLPISTPAGTAFRAVLPLDFDVISTFEERLPPAWEGTWDLGGGPFILQLFEGDFGGRERAFAVVWSPADNAIEVWELRPDLRFDGNENRVTRVIEFPSYPFGDPFGLKELESGELWFDKIFGTVDVEVFYRPDSYACWLPWHAFQLCSAKDCRELTDNPCDDTGYPQEPFCEQDAVPVALPKPKAYDCIPKPVIGASPPSRPSTIATQFQVRLVIKGWCRVRGFLLHALWREKRPFEGLVCNVGPTRL